MVNIVGSCSLMLHKLRKAWITFSCDVSNYSKHGLTFMVRGDQRLCWIESRKEFLKSMRWKTRRKPTNISQRMFILASEWFFPSSPNPFFKYQTSSCLWIHDIKSTFTCDFKGTVLEPQ